MKKQIFPILLCLLFCVPPVLAVELIVVGPLPQPPSNRVGLKVREGCAEVRFDSIRDKQYTVEFSEDLHGWDSVEDEIFGTGSSIVCSNDLDGVQKGFYRMRYSDEFTISINPACFHEGSKWTFSVTEEDLLEGSSTTRTELERIKMETPKNGYDVIGWRVGTDEGELIHLEYLLQDMSNGVFLVGVKDASGEKTFFDPPDPSAINRFVPGVQSDPVTEPSPEPGFGPVTTVGTVSIEYGTITTPAGSFQNTIKSEQRMTGTYTEGGETGFYTYVETTWYSKEVAEVKSVSTLSFDGYGTVMVETRVLTSYTLN